jgi:DNA adenine methylase
LAQTILKLIPDHKTYCEPFVGGAAIFFAKEPVANEIINDTNGELINFYEVAQRDFPALEKEVTISLHSRKLHKHAEVVYSNPEMFDRIKRAWAIWILANSSYGSKLDGAYQYDATGKICHKLKVKRDSFTTDIAIRLQNTQIECCDALRIIQSRDSADTFFYLDPPYVGADQGHYNGYTQHDFDALLSVLATIKGRFLLSSYRNKTLADTSATKRWHTQEFRMASPMANNKKSVQKIEVLTANYPIADRLATT